MALYKVALRQSVDEAFPRRYKWSTTFILNTATADAAAAAMVVGWQNYLRNAARTTVFAYEAYATSLVAGDDDYVIQPIPIGQQRGTLLPGGGQPYWPEVCVAVTIPTLTGGRPSRKFWRPGLYEGDVENGSTISSLLAQDIIDGIAQFITEAGGAVVDPDGQELGSLMTARLTRRAIGREAGFNLPIAPPVG